MALYRYRYRVRSTRLSTFDYASPGHYFVTICTRDRITLFGEINGGILQQSPIGMLTSNFWEEIPNHFPHVKLDVYVIMPNHVQTNRRDLPPERLY